MSGFGQDRSYEDTTCHVTFWSWHVLACALAPIRVYILEDPSDPLVSLSCLLYN